MLEACVGCCNVRVDGEQSSCYTKTEPKFRGEICIRWFESQQEGHPWMGSQTSRKKRSSARIRSMPRNNERIFKSKVSRANERTTKPPEKLAASSCPRRRSLNRAMGAFLVDCSALINGSHLGASNAKTTPAHRIA